jgi:hypothetical protein
MEIKREISSYFLFVKNAPFAQLKLELETEEAERIFVNFNDLIREVNAQAAGEESHL